ncbi:MAG: nucleotidyltransferase domain-containing protein [Bacteroidales bacterium]|nr:nucleotidyltransferase domain-containing protein [Bacteroidales bacterium]
MNQNIINKISNYFNTKPIEKAWIFGSYSRNEESDKSDIDILVKFSPNNKITLFYYLQLKYELEKLTGKSIDFVEEGQLEKFALESFNKDKVLIYERTN